MSSRATILVVEDDRSAAVALARILERDSYRVVSAGSVDEARNHLGDGIDLVLSDLRLGADDGMDLLNLWRRERPATPFILMTAYAEIASAVRATKLGAEDYLPKPIDTDALLSLIRKCLVTEARDAPAPPLQRGSSGEPGFEGLVGQSQVMLDVFARIRRAAKSESTILILGESGTGKELVAEAVHRNSPRKNGPFIAVNMAAVPGTLVESELFGHVKGSFTGATASRIGRFQAANGGTIFIDEVGDFALESQAKMLRVLETRTITPVGGNHEVPVDVRVVAATSRNLQEMVAAGQFREDLFYRLSVVTLSLPALSERLEDVPSLTRHFLKQLCHTNQRSEISVDPELMSFLETFDWPGNVRQLRNCLENMVVMADRDVLTVEDLPDGILETDRTTAGVPRVSPSTTIENLEKAAMLQALERFQGNRTQSAKSLGISVRTLQRRLRSWGIDATPEKTQSSGS